MASIAFIGLGNMGGPMAANLVKAGHKVIAFDLVDASKSQARSDGATIADSAAAAVKGADTVITMLPAGKHVISVWTDVISAMSKGALIIDCSTIDVESAKQANVLASKHGMASVDARLHGSGGPGSLAGCEAIDQDFYFAGSPARADLGENFAQGSRLAGRHDRVRKMGINRVRSVHGLAG